MTLHEKGPVVAPRYQVIDGQQRLARTPGESHGLGLAICRRIVTAHGGKVSVESHPGQGTCFRIVLPVEGASQEGRATVLH